MDDVEETRQFLYAERNRKAAEQMKEIERDSRLEPEPNWRVIRKVLEIRKGKAAAQKMISEKKRQYADMLDQTPYVEDPVEEVVAPIGSHEFSTSTIEKRVSQALEDDQITLIDPDDLERKITKPSPARNIPIQGDINNKINPYVRGDDINQDYFTFLRANIIAGKHAKPTLEEDATFYFALRAYANGESVMFKGPSRSGKSLLADRISMLSEHVIVGGASNNALLDYTDSINTIGKVYITEHQSVVDPNPRIKEIVKHILEGKDYEFLSGGKTKRLDGTSQILTTAADENRQTQKIDVELYARYTPFRTTLTPEKIATISEYMNGLEDGTIDDVVFPEEALDRIKTHFEAIRENETVSFINPFIKAYAEHLPETQKSLHSRSIYLGLIKASTKFDSVNRVEANDKLVTNLSDLYLVHEYKYDEYCENLQLLTAQTFYSHRNNPNELEKTKHESTKEYELGLIDEVRQKEVDWCSIWKTGFELMETHQPKKLQEWVDLNSKNGMVMVYDPIAKQEIEICPVGDDTYA